MPRTRSLAWAELKIGLLTIFALAVTAMLIFAVGGDGGFFWQRYPLKARFDNVASLKAGSPVRLAGVEVGSIDSVHFQGVGVDIWFSIDERHRPLVTTDSVASIGSVSLLGEGAIDLQPASTGTPIPDWGYVPTGPAEGSIAQLTEQAARSLDEATRLFRDIRSGRGTIGRFFTDDTVYQEVARFVGAAQRVTDAVASGKGTLGRLTIDPSLYNELQASMQNLNAITGSIRRGEGSLGRLMTDPAFGQSVTATTENLSGITGKINRGEGTLGKLVTDDAVYARLNDLTGRLDTLVARLDEGQGTAGQLLRDKQLYENMNSAAAELRSLIGDIRKDPKKYLNVKVSIF
ncbi:MAG: MlaD family protein [Acidobacteriota bacterium]